MQYPGIPRLGPAPARVGCLFLPDMPTDPAPQPPAAIAHLVHVRRVGQMVVWCVSAPASLQRICPDGDAHLPIPRAATHPLGATASDWNLCWPRALTNPLMRNAPPRPGFPPSYPVPPPGPHLPVPPTAEPLAVQCVYFPKTGIGTPGPPDAPTLSRESFGKRWKVCATAPAVFRKSCPPGWRSMGLPDAATNPDAPTSSGWLLCWPRPRASVPRPGQRLLPGMGAAVSGPPRAPRAPALATVRQALVANPPQGSLVVWPQATLRNPEVPERMVKTAQVGAGECDEGYDLYCDHGSEDPWCWCYKVDKDGTILADHKPHKMIGGARIRAPGLPGMPVPPPRAPFSAVARAGRQLARGMQLPGMPGPRSKISLQGQWAVPAQVAEVSGSAQSVSLPSSFTPEHWGDTAWAEQASTATFQNPDCVPPTVFNPVSPAQLRAFTSGPAQVQAAIAQRAPGTAVPRDGRCYPHAQPCHRRDQVCAYHYCLPDPHGCAWHKGCRYEPHTTR